MTDDTPDLRRFRLIFALEKLSPALRADVLADGAIVARFDVPAKRPAQLTDTVTVLRDDLFAAFRNASDGLASVPITDEHGATVDARIWIDPDGSGIVEIEQKRLRFAQAALLSSHPARRLAHLETFLHQYPVTKDEGDRLRTLVTKPDYSNEDFFSAVTIFASSPQAFVERLREKLKNPDGEHRIGQTDVLPDDIRHWDHLTAPVAHSPTLSEYINNELQAERTVRLDVNPKRAFLTMSLTFAAPSLVPFSLVREFDVEALAAMIDAASKVDDHFALEGAFEVCADQVQRDSRFVALGDRLLDRLFGDMDRLAAACGMFAAIFVVATAYLAEHETLGRRPVYWRRLAAATHASLVVRVCGTSGINPDDIVSWAMRISGETYFMSVLSDLAVEPQWKPEWILPHFLLADVAGRALGTLHRLPSDAAPESWKTRLDVLRTWIADNKLDPLLAYPAVLEGTRRPRQPTLAGFEAGGAAAAVSAYRDLAENPSIDQLIGISPLIEAFDFPAEPKAAVAKVLDLVRQQGPDSDQQRIVVALSILAHISVLTNDVSLADGVADACLERVLPLTNPGAVFEIVARLVECSGACADRDAARAALAQRLEVLAFSLPSSRVISALITAVESLRRVQPDLAPLLGRALAAARLAQPRSSAA
jgi:hypothetical protein